MADWLAQVVRHLAQSPAVQLIIRVHPGELLGAGHPSIEIVQAELPQLPPHVIVVPPESKVNTYDLIGLAQVGMVYTSTVGLEMAMSGLPVIVAGQTHYRGKGFTVDPSTLPAFFAAVDSILHTPRERAVVKAQVELAQRYAYRYFFEYPFRFPWHLLTLWEDLAARPFEEVVRDEGLNPYRRTLDALTGQPIDWGSAGNDLRGLV
jgi:capsule polysaccharide export protein KpsC/LpsZ